MLLGLIHADTGMTCTHFPFPDFFVLVPLCIPKMAIFGWPIHAAEVNWQIQLGLDKMLRTNPIFCAGNDPFQLKWMERQWGLSFAVFPSEYCHGSFCPKSTLDTFLNEKPQNTRAVSLYCAIWRRQTSSTGVHQRSASLQGKFRQHIYYRELS